MLVRAGARAQESLKTTSRSTGDLYSNAIYREHGVIPLIVNLIHCEWKLRRGCMRVSSGCGTVTARCDGGQHCRCTRNTVIAEALHVRVALAVTTLPDRLHLQSHHCIRMQHNMPPSRPPSINTRWKAAPLPQCRTGVVMFVPHYRVQHQG